MKITWKKSYNTMIDETKFLNFIIIYWNMIIYYIDH